MNTYLQLAYPPDLLAPSVLYVNRHLFEQCEDILSYTATLVSLAPIFEAYFSTLCDYMSLRAE